MGLSLLWRDTDRELDIVIEDPNGVTFQVPASMAYQQFDGGIWIYTERDDSSRGTSRVDVYLFDPDGMLELNPGDWTAHVTDPSPPAAGDIELIGMVIDDISGWAMGIHFPEDATEDHLIGWPGTADYGIAVAAYTGTGITSGTPGERAYYSGRGYRIDGVDILSISAPADPIVPAYRDTEEASYRVYGGTSGASPHVAGVAALLAQQNPEATGEDIRSLIRDNALVDGNVGEVPNHDWGYGKLRAYNAMYGEDPPGGSAPIISPVDGQVYLDEATTVAIGVNDAEEPDQLVIEVDDDYDGAYDRTLAANTFEVTFNELGVYYSKLRVTDPTGRSAAALARFEVVERPPAPKTKRDDDLPPVINGRGAPCLCAAPGAPSAPQPYAWLALGLAIASCRVRRSGKNRDRSFCRANRRRPGCEAS
jgi:hypothetical protein